MAFNSDALTQNLLNAGGGMYGPTPEQALASSQEDYNAAMRSPNAQVRNQANIQAGVKNFFGNGPQVQQAVAVQNRLKQIMADVNTQYPDDSTDPLTKQLMTAQAVATGMGNINPQIAMKAMQQASALQEAKQQQSYLQTRQQYEATQSKEANLKLSQSIAAGANRHIVSVDQDEDGMPMIKQYGTVQALDSNGNLAPDFQDQFNTAMKAAKDAGASNPIMMTDAELAAGKLQNGVLRAQTLLQKDQADNAEKTQQAYIRAATAAQSAASRGQHVSPQIMAVMTSGSNTASILDNLSEMPVGTTMSRLGTLTPGKSAWDAGGDALKNRLTSLDAQRYQQMTVGMDRNIAQLEMYGRVQGMQTFAEKLNSAMAFREGDETPTVMNKLADARQIYENVIKYVVKDPGIPQELRDIAQTDLEKVQKAIPWTVHDVTAYVNANQKNPKLTFRDWASNHGLGQAAETPTPDNMVSNAYKAGGTYKGQQILGVHRTGGVVDQIHLQDGSIVSVGK